MPAPSGLVTRLKARLFGPEALYAGRDERKDCVCGAPRHAIPRHLWKVSDKTTDLINPMYMYRCPACASFSALNLYFPVEKYDEHTLEAMTISGLTHQLNLGRHAWITQRVDLGASPVLYDLGSGPGSFTHIFGEA